MSESARIISFLELNQIGITGTVVRDNRPGNHYFVVVPVSRNSENKQIPTNKNLLEVKKQLEEQGLHIEFLLTDAGNQDIEAGLRATILHAFGNSIRNVFASISSGKANVWLESKHQLDDSKRAGIKNRASHFLNEVGIELSTIALVSEENLPSMYSCMTVIRQLSPIDIPHLNAALEAKGFVIPSQDWLTRRLDAMRRSGRIVRREDGKYLLTLQSLRSMGTSKNRKSPDISRLLALTRRGV